MENTLTVIIIVIGVIIFGWLGYLTYRFFAYIKEKEELLKKARGKDVESLLEESLKQTETARQDIKKIYEALDGLGKLAIASITKVAVVRFNPFNDTGSNQSFAIAFLNAENSGMVMSSLHGREGTRIYSKPIKEGKSEHHLTGEEVEVIEKAQKK